MKNKFVKTLLKNNKSDDNFTKILLSNGSKILNVHKVEPDTFELIQNEIKKVKVLICLILLFLIILFIGLYVR